ncbi:MAG: HepT-like ribonuclease domain-containing protein [Pseudonocardiaceae bacterium]
MHDEIGEAVKGIDPGVLAHEPSIPWSDVAGMRDYLTHRYFDTDLARRHPGPGRRMGGTGNGPEDSGTWAGW